MPFTCHPLYRALLLPRPLENTESLWLDSLELSGHAGQFHMLHISEPNSSLGSPEQ